MLTSVLGIGFALVSAVALWQFLLARKLRRTLENLRAEHARPKNETEARLRQIEERFRSLMDNAPFQIVLKDIAGRYVQVNRAWERDYGQPAEAAPGRGPADFFPELLATMFADRDTRVLRNGIATEIEEIVPHPDGTDHTYLATRFPIFDGAGEVAGLWFIATDITAMKETERALRESNARFRAIMDHSPVEILLKDKEGRYIEASRSWEEYNGVTLAEAVGKLPRDLFGEDYASNLSARDMIALERGDVIETQDWAPHPDGTRHVFHTISFPIPGEDGEPAYLGMVSSDVTERMAAEAALRESEEQLRTITDNLPALIVRCDMNQRFTFANRQAERWYGRLSPAIVGKTIAELFGDNAAGEAASMMQSALSGERVRFETKLCYPDGITREVEIAYIPDTADDGSQQGVFALVQDIRERRSAERALRDSEAQVRTITDNLPVLVSYRDLEGVFRFVNRIGEKWFACPASEIIGRTSKEVLPDTDQERRQRKIDGVLAGQPQQFEAAILYPDGVNRQVDVSYIPDIADDGQVRGWFGLVLDVTDRKDMENELLRKERLAALGQLTGTVAHELRNPLGAIAMSMGVIRQHAAGNMPQLDRALERADRGMARCERIITELLDFARAKGLQREPTALDIWLKNLLDDLDIDGQINFERDIAVDTLVPLVDREALRRAVINVVENACQALLEKEAVAENKARLHVSFKAGNNRVKMTFSDNGPGIPSDLLPKIMEPLFSTKNFGTGLGLPTVKRIMEDHGGGMEFESEVGVGTRVVLWLPAGNHNEAGTYQ